MSSYIVFKVPDHDEAVEKQSKSFDCPCCGATLQFLTRVTIAGVRPVTDGDGQPLRLDMESNSAVVAASPDEIKTARQNGHLTGDGRLKVSVNTRLPMQVDINKDSAQARFDKKATEDELSILAEAEKHGILAAFERAIHVSSGAKPSAIKPYFLKFLNSATKKKVPRLGLELALKESKISTGPGDKIELWRFNNICAITVNDAFQIFLPLEFVRGDDVEKINMDQGNVKKEIVTSGEWYKSGGGYVGKGGGLFAAHLKAKSYGTLSGN